MTDAKPRAEARPCTASVHMYSAVPVPCVLLYLYLFSTVAAPSAKQPVHGMSLVAAARSRLPGAAAPSGAITATAVGTHRQGQRQRRDQGQEQGHEQRQGQGQRNAGTLQGWMEVSGATAGADYKAARASPSSLLSPPLPSSSSSPPPSSSSPPPTSLLQESPPFASKPSGHSTTPRKPEAIISTPRAAIPKSCKAVTTATPTKNNPSSDSFKSKSSKPHRDSLKPELSKTHNSASSNTALGKLAKSEAPAHATAPAAASATTVQLKSLQGKTTGRQPKALSVEEASTPAKGKVTGFASNVARGILATAGLFFILASSPSEQRISDDNAHDKCEITWNPFHRDDSRSHTTGDRHPSWSNRPNKPSDDAPPGSNRKGPPQPPPGSNQIGPPQESSGTVPSVQGRGQEGEAKEGEGKSNAGDDEKRGGEAKTDEQIEREWPVFGSDGVGGRFGAF